MDVWVGSFLPKYLQTMPCFTDHKPSHDLLGWNWELTSSYCTQQSNSTVSWDGSKSSSSFASLLINKITLLINWDISRDWIPWVTVGKVQICQCDVIRVDFSSFFKRNHENRLTYILDTFCLALHIPCPHTTLCPRKWTSVHGSSQTSLLSDLRPGLDNLVDVHWRWES